MAQTSPNPLALHVVRAEGNYLFDVHGNRYLDLIAGISVCNIGHQHPNVVEAVKAQAEKFMHVMVYGETIQTPQSTYAKRLIEQLPSTLNCCYFVNSGAEAIDGAMKLAKRVTGKTDFVALTDAYHGSTQGPLSLMSNEYYSQAFRPLLLSVHFVKQNDLEALSFIPWNQVSAVVVELIQAERGAKKTEEAFLKALRSITTFGGHPIVAAAGNAAFDVLLTNQLVETVKSKEALFRSLLQHPKIKAVHGEGLLLAVELESFETVQQTIQQMLAKGLFSDWFLFAPNCLRIAPPLTISMEEIHWACDQILDVLSEL